MHSMRLAMKQHDPFCKVYKAWVSDCVQFKIITSVLLIYSAVCSKVQCHIMMDNGAQEVRKACWCGAIITSLKNCKIFSSQNLARRPWSLTAVRINSFTYLSLSSVTHQMCTIICHLCQASWTTTPRLFLRHKFKTHQRWLLWTADERPNNAAAYPRIWLHERWWKIQNYSRQCNHNPTNYPSLFSWLKRGKKWS